MPSPDLQRSEPNRLSRAAWAVPLFCALIGTAVSVRSIGYEFVYDDHLLIRENALLQPGAGWNELLMSNFWAGADNERGLYRPVTLAVWRLEWTAGGGSPAFFHGMSILLYGVLCGAVALFCRQVLTWFRPSATPAEGSLAGLAAGVLFALHPVHVEPVAWVSGQSELLAALFLLGALVFSLKAASSDKGAWACLAGLVWFLALGSKESSAILPLLLALLILGRQGARDRLYRPVMSWLLFSLGLAAAVYFGARWAALGGDLTPRGSEAILEGAGPVTRILAAGRVMAFAGKMLLAPSAFSPNHQIPDLGTFSLPAAVGWLGFLAVVAGSALLWQRNRGVCFGLAWSAASLLPYLHLIPFGERVAERFLFTPSIGVCLLAGEGAASLVRARQSGRLSQGHAVFAAALALAFAVMLSAVFLSRIPAWKDDVTLWSVQLADHPEDVKALRGVGLAFMDQGEWGLAILNLEKALEVGGEDFETMVNLSTAQLRAGAYDEAEVTAGRLLQQGLATESPAELISIAFQQRAWARKGLGDLEGALEDSRRAVELAPMDSEARRLLDSLTEQQEGS